MSTIKFLAKKIREEKDNKGQKRNIIEVEAAKNEPCKQCGKNPRQGGSARCKECADIYRMHKFEQRRLEKKIKAENIKTNYQKK